MVDRLAEDHANARDLAEGLAGIQGLRIDPEAVETNIVHFSLEPGVGLTPGQVCTRLAEDHEIWLGTDVGNLLRAVTHYWVGEKEVAQLLEAIAVVIG